MDLITKLEALGVRAMTAIEHGAAWLVGAAAVAQTDVAALEKESPLVQSAVTAGLALAEKHGVPIIAVEDAGAAVLAMAQQIAAKAPPAS